MPSGDLLLAIDQGTSSSKALLVDVTGAIVATGSGRLSQSHPRPGWVEQSLDEVWSSVCHAVAACIGSEDPNRIAAVGLSTQRESLVLWDRSTGAPVAPLISWQDQRTASTCTTLLASGVGAMVRDISGLPLDPMFSATKASWLLDHADPARSASSRGELCLGTTDSWLLSRFGGDHVIEIGNAARTQLFDVRRRTWSPVLLDLFNVPAEVLPRVVSSTGPFPAARGLPLLRDGTPIAAVMGDSHAALFAHAGWRQGQVKATYGTGSSVMAPCEPSVDPGPGLCVTIAWDDGQPRYAVEGNIRSSGSTLSWLAEVVDSTPHALARLADTATSDGVFLVPAFNGLGAPWWDRDAPGLLTGLTLGTRLPQIARAALESIAFQVHDVVAAVDAAVSPVDVLLADGGASANAVLMQIQADVSGRPVERALAGDLSPLGAAHLAGRSIGMWSTEQLERLERPRQRFLPRSQGPQEVDLARGWQRAVARARWRPDA